MFYLVICVIFYCEVKEKKSDQPDFLHMTRYSLIRECSVDTIFFTIFKIRFFIYSFFQSFSLFSSESLFCCFCCLLAFFNANWSIFFIKYRQGIKKKIQTKNKSQNEKLFCFPAFFPLLILDFNQTFRCK